MKTSIQFLSTFCSVLQIFGFISIALNSITTEHHQLLMIIVIASGIAAIINWFLLPRNILSTLAMFTGIGLIIIGFMSH